MAENPGSRPTIGARIAVVLAYLAVAPLLVAFLIVWRGNPTNAAVFYTDGGVFMHAIVLLLLVQICMGAIFAVKYLDRPRSVLWFSTIACAAVAVGALGAHVGVSLGWEAVASSSNDKWAQMWTASCSVADLSRQLGLAAAGLLTAPLVVVGFVAARRHSQAPGWSAALATGATGALVLSTTLSSMSTMPLTRSSEVVPVWIGVGALIGLVFLSLAARHIHSLSAVDPRLAFELSLLCAVGFVGPVFGQVAAAGLGALGDAMSAIAMAPPDQKTALLMEHASTFRQMQMTLWVFGGAATLTALVPIGFVAKGAKQWLGRSVIGWAIAAVLAILAGLAAHSVDEKMNHHQAELEKMEAVHVPRGMELPISEAISGVDPQKAQVVLHRGEISVRTDGAAAKVDPDDLVAHLQRVTEGELGKCDSPRGPTIVVADAGEVFGEVLAVAKSLGPCIEVAMLPRPFVEAKASHDPEYQAKILEQLGDVGIVDELLVMVFGRQMVAPVRLAAQAPSSSMVLEVGRGTVRVGDDTLQLADREDDRAKLDAVLRTARVGRPDLTAYAVAAQKGATLQDVMTVMEVAGRRPQGQHQAPLFDACYWLREP